MELSIPAIGMNKNGLGIESKYDPTIYWVETNKWIRTSNIKHSVFSLELGFRV